MGAMHEFLTRLKAPIRALPRLDAVWERRAAGLNARLQAAEPGSSGESLVHLTFNYLKYALAGCSVLPARAGPVLGLARHGSSSASTTATRTSPRSRTAWWRQPGDAARRLVVVNPALTNKAIVDASCVSCFRPGGASSIGSTSSLQLVQRARQ
jgi:hypothetical protein